MEGIFREIYIDPSIRDKVKSLNPHGARVLTGFPERDGKDILFITSYKGNFFKPCPGTKKYICCKYKVFNVFVGCPYDCTYCILQGYLDHLTTYFYINFEKGFEEVERFLNENRNHIYRIGTGELGDSLAIEPYIPTAKEFVDFFSSFNNAIFEFKTKSLNMDTLKGLDHRGRIVVSTSLTPRDIWVKEEIRVPDPFSRIEKLKEMEDYGYYIGLHFDPIIWFKNWKRGYEDLLEAVEVLDPKKIIWISLGGFRFPKEVKEIIEKRHPQTGIFLGEILPCGEDGKYRYFKKIRIEMYKFIVERLKRWSEDLFIYFCMERKDVWERVFGRSPSSNEELDSMFVERILELRRREGDG